MSEIPIGPILLVLGLLVTMPLVLRILHWMDSDGDSQ